MSRLRYRSIVVYDGPTVRAARKIKKQHGLSWSDFLVLAMLLYNEHVNDANREEIIAIAKAKFKELTTAHGHKTP